MLQVWQPAGFLVSIMLRTRVRQLGLIMRVGRVRGQEMLGIFFDLVKCTTVYLSVTNNATYFVVYSTKQSWIACSVPVKLVPFRWQ